MLDIIRRAKQPNLVKNPKTLVVTYLGVMSSWVEHFKMWSNLRVTAINNLKRAKFVRDLTDDSYDVYIIHYQGVRLIPEELKSVHWFHIILDECHAIQNRKSQQTLAIKSLPTEYKTGLSGTPAYDKPDDLWSLLNWLYPEFWSSYWRYYNRHMIYHDQNGYRVIIGMAHLDELQRQMAGFYIRRKKEDVLLDLPDKYRSERIIQLSPKQRRSYNQMKKDMITWVGEHEDQPVAAPIVISQIMRLQQLAAAYGYVDENGRLWSSEPSTKLDAVMDIITSTARPVVVFSQFAQVIHLLEKRLITAGIPASIYTGRIRSRIGSVRDKALDDFQQGRTQVFAGTIGAGGVGITLTAADTVVFLDRSWSASINVQAEDRLHRIGQKNAVHVIDLIADGTLEAKRIKKINMQWSWIKKLIGDEPLEEMEEYVLADDEWI